MKLFVIPDKPSDFTSAEAAAVRLGVMCLPFGVLPPSDCTHVLRVRDTGLTLGSVDSNAPAATCVDFLDATLLYRLRTSGKRQGIGKAIGLDKKARIAVLDATAGLGRDALVMAYLGCSVQMLEQSPVIHLLLEDGLGRALAAQDAALGGAPARMQLCYSDAREWFADIRRDIHPRPEVIYLDPMFPARSKSASVKKDIALLQTLLDTENDFPSLLEAARDCAQYRVVVKRPGNKPDPHVPQPSFIVPGKSAHFEVYVNSSFSSIR